MGFWMFRRWFGSSRVVLVSVECLKLMITAPFPRKSLSASMIASRSLIWECCDFLRCPPRNACARSRRIVQNHSGLYLSVAEHIRNRNQAAFQASFIQSAVSLPDQLSPSEKVEKVDVPFGWIEVSSIISSQACRQN